MLAMNGLKVKKLHNQRLHNLFYLSKQSSYRYRKLFQQMYFNVVKFIFHRHKPFLTINAESKIFIN
jgi:hypothetical protein